MKEKLIIILLTLFCNQSFGQNTEPINTDRPDQSDGTYILTTRNMQLENGITFLNSVFINNLMLRYGVTKSMEIRLLGDFGKEDSLKGLLPIGISIKQRIIKQKKFIPAITLVGYFRNGKIASKAFNNSNNSYSFLLAFQNDISDNFGIGYNIGTTDLGKDLNITTSFGYGFTDRISAFVEYFSHFEKFNSAQHNFDFGILYQLKHNLQFDIAFGKSLTKNNDLLYLTTGISYRFKNRKDDHRNLSTKLE